MLEWCELNCEGGGEIFWWDLCGQGCEMVLRWWFGDVSNGAGSGGFDVEGASEVMRLEDMH